MKTKEGKIFIVSLKKTDNYSQDIHPLLKVKNGSLVISHKPPIGTESMKLKQKDCYGLKLQGGQSYITNELTEHESGKVIGGVCRNFLKKIYIKFKEL